MISIVRAAINDHKLLSRLGRETFIASHGTSAAAHDINAYISEKYSEAAMLTELKNNNYLYHILYDNGEPAGFSKLLLRQAIDGHENTSKLERLYLQQDYYGLGLAQELLNYNITLSKQHGDQGMWLYVWTGNSRAVAFYHKVGFKIVGNHDFPISAKHSNPNHRMLLLYP
jgi:ribosomal protein S18 acetylase RimI-like enzyme